MVCLGPKGFLPVLGPVYDLITRIGDVFAFIILILILAFLFRRLFLHVKRFSGIEMKHKSHLDANFALTTDLVDGVAYRDEYLLLLYAQSDTTYVQGYLPGKRVYCGIVR